MPTTGTAFNAVAKAVSANDYKKRNASCILGLTSASSTGNVSEVMTLAQSAYNQGKNNGRNALNDTRHVIALSGGTFQYQAANKYIILGANHTLTLANVSNTTLKGSAADYRRRSIPYKLTGRTAFLSGISWTSSELEGPVYSLTISASTVSMGNDIAAMLTASARSSVFFMVNGKTATEVAYPTLTLW